MRRSDAFLSNLFRGTSAVLFLLVGLSIQRVEANGLCESVQTELLSELKVNEDSIEAFHVRNGNENWVGGKKVVLIGSDGVPVKTYIKNRFFKFDPQAGTATFEYSVAGIEGRVTEAQLSSQPLERLRSGRYREFKPPQRPVAAPPAPVEVPPPVPRTVKPEMVHGQFSERSIEEYLVIKDNRVVDRTILGAPVHQSKEVESTLNRLFNEDPDAYIRINLNAQRKVADSIARQTGRPYSEVEREVFRTTRWRRPPGYIPSP